MRQIEGLNWCAQDSLIFIAHYNKKGVKFHFNVLIWVENNLISLFILIKANCYYKNIEKDNLREKSIFYWIVLIWDKNNWVLAGEPHLFCYNSYPLENYAMFDGNSRICFQ